MKVERIVKTPEPPPVEYHITLTASQAYLLERTLLLCVDELDMELMSEDMCFFITSFLGHVQRAMR